MITNRFLEAAVRTNITLQRLNFRLVGANRLWHYVIWPAMSLLLKGPPIGFLLRQT